MKPTQVIPQGGKVPSAVIGPCRLSYVFLSEPFKAQGATEGKYMATLLIPKNNIVAVKAIKELIDQAMSYGKAAKWGNQIPRNCRTPLRDGDERENDPDGIYKGHYYICASSAKKVPVYSRDGLPIMDAEQLYSGMWGSAAIAFAPYASAGNNGVGAYLNAVQKVADDEKFGGGGVSASVFGTIAVDDDDDDDI